MVNCKVNINLLDDAFVSCGDIGVSIDNLLTTELVNINTINEFTNTIQSELIDVKNRKVINSYPLLKLLYERYKLGFQHNISSGKYDYFIVEKFTKSIGNYWINIIEQVIPSTTIWGSTYKYRNTIFDVNKYNYKKYTLQTCSNISNIMYPSPTIGVDLTIGVDIIDVSDIDIVNCIIPETEMTKCDGVHIEQYDNGSEFIGNVYVSYDIPTGDTIPIECNLTIENIDGTVESTETEWILTVFPILNGVNGELTYNWNIIDKQGKFSNVSYDKNDNENFILHIPRFDGELTEDDIICISLLVRDENGCESTLNLCNNGDSIN